MGSKCYFGIVLHNDIVRIEDTTLKESFIMHVGCINENKGNNWIFGCFKYITYAILFRISLKR